MILTTSINRQSITDIRNALGLLTRADVALSAATDVQVAVITQRLKDAVAKQFTAGTDKDGRSHNKNGATLATLKAFVTGHVGRVTMEKGAVFVEFGSKAHIIEVSSAQALRWENASGIHFAKSVHHPGYVGDDFAGRAIDEIVGTGVLTSAFSQIALRFFGGLSPKRV